MIIRTTQSQLWVDPVRKRFVRLPLEDRIRNYLHYDWEKFTELECGEEHIIIVRERDNCRLTFQREVKVA